MTTDDRNVYVTKHALFRFDERVSKSRKRRILTTQTAKAYLAHLALHGELLHEPVLDFSDNEIGTTTFRGDRDAVAVVWTPLHGEGMRVLTVVDKARYAGGKR